MATIHRHPVPTDSYDPKRPLNDLLVAQLEHFKHIAKSLPSDLRNTVPAEPSTEDREGADRFIAAVTGIHVRRKSLAAVAEEQPKKTRSAKSKPQGKPKSKAKRGSAPGSKA